MITTLVVDLNRSEKFLNKRGTFKHISLLFTNTKQNIKN